MDLRKTIVLLSLPMIFAGCVTLDTKMNKYYMGPYEYTRNQPRQIQNLDIVHERFPSISLESPGQNLYVRGWSSWQISFDVTNAKEDELDRMKDYISRCRCSSFSTEATEYPSNTQDESSNVQRNLRVYLDGADAKKLLDRFRGSFDLPLSVLSIQLYIDAFKYPPERPIEVPVQQP